MVYKQEVVEIFCLSVAATSRRLLPSRASVSYDAGHLIGSGFSKTLMALWSEKRVSSMGFENGKPLNFCCACHDHSPAHNRSISSNERPDTRDPCLKSLRSSHNKTQLPRFPFGCYTNPWVVSVPIPLRYWMAASQDLTAKVHTIIRTTIGQYYVNQAVARGLDRATVHPGSVTFIQRFGSAINVNLHFHCVFMEGVYVDRTTQGLRPRFVQGESPTDADIAAVVQKISRRVIRTLRRLGYLETGMEAPVATGYDPLRDHEPALARTMAASVQQRIACGERAGQPVRRIGAGFGHEGEAPRLTGPRCACVHGFSLHAQTQIPAHRRDQLERLIRYTARGAVSLERLTHDANGDRVSTFTHPWSDGTTGIRLSPVELLEKLAALVPLPRVHLVRYGGCLAPHSHLRHAIMPTPRQQGRDGEETQRGTPYWTWARLLKRVFALEMGPCPFCQRGVLRLIAVITQGEVMRKILRHLKLAADPPPIASARSRQARCDWVA